MLPSSPTNIRKPQVSLHSLSIKGPTVLSVIPSPREQRQKDRLDTHDWQESYWKWEKHIREKLKKEAPKAETKSEEKKGSDQKAAGGEKKKEKMEEAKPPEPVVLFVDMHCVGCAKKVEQTILDVRGVEDVEVDMMDNRVRVKGMLDPLALCTTIQQRTKREASVLYSPASPTEEEEENGKSNVVNCQAGEMSTLVLNINMHCVACALQLQKRILRIRGVQTVETELESSRVTVTGTMDANKLAEYIYRRTRKQVSIVPLPPPPPPKVEEEKAEDVAEAADVEKKEEETPTQEAKKEKEGVEEKKEEKGEREESKDEDERQTGPKGSGGDEEGGQVTVVVEDDLKKMTVFYPPMYVIERVYAPQFFSDENPNACCIS